MLVMPSGGADMYISRFVFKHSYFQVDNEYFFMKGQPVKLLFDSLKLPQYYRWPNRLYGVPFQRIE